MSTPFNLAWPVSKLGPTATRRRVLKGLNFALAVPMAFSLSLHAASAATEPVASGLEAPHPAPAQPAWPGVVQLEVDATDLAHRVLSVRQTLALPAAGAGGSASQRLTLWYPRYLPGAHGPWGNPTLLAGLVIEAGGQRLPWWRDNADPYAFHVEPPSGVRELVLRFQYLSPLKPGLDRVSVTRQMLGVEWESVLLVPAGVPANALRVAARLKLPSGWQQVSALRNPAAGAAFGSAKLPQPGANGWVDFAETSLETLVDSPVFAGCHLRREALDPPGTAQPVTLSLLADEPEDLNPSLVQLEAHRALVRQADALFGPRHFRHYELMLAQSEEFGELGLEHHESSENVVRPGYFKDWGSAVRDRELLAHEFTHSWNGKFRRPADLWTPHYNTPMRTSLLWVYEGQTEYWGQVLAVRAGLVTPEQARDRLAWRAANVLATSGRAWRPLQDTTLEPSIGPGHNTEWGDWQRGYDYYAEGALMWLEVDARLRELSAGQRSLDDFARTFFGQLHRSGADGSITPMTYDLNTVVTTLAQVQPGFDWRGLLRQRLDHTGGPEPLQEGLALSGWRLGWTSEESSFARNERGWSGPNGNERPQDLGFSLGLRVTSDGNLDQVFWGSPAFEAGLSPGMTLLAVNDRGYKPERLAAAVAANTSGQAPIRLLLRDKDRYFSVSLDWRGGLRYPRLERIEGTPDQLSAIHAAR
jgi:predicted metalloprotease with PDZ domain